MREFRRGPTALQPMPSHKPSSEELRNGSALKGILFSSYTLESVGTFAFHLGGMMFIEV